MSLREVEEFIDSQRKSPPSSPPRQSAIANLSKTQSIPIAAPAGKSARKGPASGSPPETELLQEVLQDGQKTNLKGWSDASVESGDAEARPAQPRGKQQKSALTAQLQQQSNSGGASAAAEVATPEMATLQVPQAKGRGISVDTTKKTKEEKKGGDKEKKGPPADIPEKKQMTKAERRAVQEAQRLAKGQKASGGPATAAAPVAAAGAGAAAPLGKGKGAAGGKTPDTTELATSPTAEDVAGSVPRNANKGARNAPNQFDDEKKKKAVAKKQIAQRTVATKQVKLFSHLPQYERETSMSLSVGGSAKDLHPAILQLGLMFAEGQIAGSNARCVAMLTAFKLMLQDYETPPNKTLQRDLDTKIKPCIQFLIDCRPMSISMANAVRWFKLQISTLPADMPEQVAKDQLLANIDTFIYDRIIVASQIIAGHGVDKIQDGDVILTFASSHAVEATLKQAYDEAKKFRVICVDSRPKLEGKNLLRRLNGHGISCTYIMSSAVSYIMSEVTKVMLGAFSFMSNGTALSRAGTAVVAMTAHAYHVPVIFCCETYKFCERVQLDSIVSNELGDPDELVALNRDRENPLAGWRDVERLKLLNLVYDLTPIQFISMVITEVGLIPPTSVPVVVREYQRDIPA